jgi:hypothetical protein
MRKMVWLILEKYTSFSKSLQNIDFYIIPFTDHFCCCHVCKKTKDGGADGHGITLFWTKEAWTILFITVYMIC